MNDEVEARRQAHIKRDREAKIVELEQALVAAERIIERRESRIRILVICIHEISNQLADTFADEPEE